MQVLGAWLRWVELARQAAGAWLHWGEPAKQAAGACGGEWWKAGWEYGVGLPNRR